MKQETYKAARSRLLKELAERGWEVKPNLVRPQAISPDKSVQLFFRAQSVYLDNKKKGQLSMWVDIRNLPVEELIRKTGYRPIS